MGYQTFGPLVGARTYKFTIHFFSSNHSQNLHKNMPVSMLSGEKPYMYKSEKAAYCYVQYTVQTVSAKKFKGFFEEKKKQSCIV